MSRPFSRVPAAVSIASTSPVSSASLRGWCPNRWIERRCGIGIVLRHEESIVLRVECDAVDGEAARRDDLDAAARIDAGDAAARGADEHRPFRARADESGVSSVASTLNDVGSAVARTPTGFTNPAMTSGSVPA